MMLFLLVMATLLAPIMALMFADWWRMHRRARKEKRDA